MHAAIRGSKLDILPDAGHLLNLEQPHLFNAAVTNSYPDLIRGGRRGESGSPEPGSPI
jgi:pimeloyl-ACP methyl ester carboxylesterase